VARASMFVAGMALGFAFGTLVMISHADPASAEVQAAAEQAQVDPQDLLGAVNTTGLDPFTYLRAVGELPPLKVARAPIPPPAVTIWDTLARCESTSNWSARTGNGFYGGLQFDFGTWLAYGGGAFAPRADLATRAQQISIAERLRSARGYAPWPACSRALGLR